MGDYNMASKQAAIRKTSGKPRKAQDLRKLLEKSQHEIAKLLQREKDRTLTGRELEIGLEEVEEFLERILAYKKASL
jgi:hypothetical protein